MRSRVARLFELAGSSQQERAVRSIRPIGDRLEPRIAMSASPAVVMLSATTTNSQSVTIDYRVNTPAALDTPLQFGVYRSSSSQFGAGASLVDTVTLSPGTASTPMLDSAGNSPFAPGEHQVTLALPGGLPPFPSRPYVLVVADPAAQSSLTDPQETAAFRVYTIGVVTHGGIQDPSWTHGPPWQLETAYLMKEQGFDSVIAYNWALLSSTPGEAIKQSPRLARDILHAASKFPSGSVIDLELIGHSEGTVVNAYALRQITKEMPPGLKAGYIVDTLLDPHAANNNVPGQQYSTAGILGPLANAVISSYQGQAKDPPAYVPAVVDQAYVFYQHNQSTASAIENLWGQVPVVTRGPVVHYFNLSATGATHSGNTGVALWYRNFVAPTLGDQAPLVQDLTLTAQVDAQPFITPHLGVAHAAVSGQTEFSGTSAPNSTVRLYVGPANNPTSIHLAGWTRASSAGAWTLSPRRSLHAGRYRAVVTAFSRELRTRPGLTVIPTAPLGLVVVKS